jgi:hypothetical protein
MALKYYNMAERCITVLFILSGGDEQALIDKEEFFRQCNAFKVFEMTDKEFTQFKFEKLNPVEMVKRGDIWPKK